MQPTDYDDWFFDTNSLLFSIDIHGMPTYYNIVPDCEQGRFKFREIVGTFAVAYNIHHTLQWSTSCGYYICC